MIVSALSTSLGINFGLSILFLALFSVLRKQPGNLKIYKPRKYDELQGRLGAHFRIDDIIPTPGWLHQAWKPSEEELLSSCGLDAVVLNRIFVFALRVLSVATVIGLCVLLPVNYFGDNLQDIDFSDFSNKSLDVFTISNVNDGSKMLWFHFSAAYIITGATCFLLYVEFKYISKKHLDFFNNSKRQPQHFTILVHYIPVSGGQTIDEIIEKFFKQYHPSTYLYHTVIRRTNELRKLKCNTIGFIPLPSDAESLYRRITQLKLGLNSSDLSQQGVCLGLFGKKVDLVDHYEKKLEDVEQNVRLELSDIYKGREEVPAAFVYFSSRYAVGEALHIQQSVNPIEWMTEEAPEPHDVYWPFFSLSFTQKWISKLVVLILSILLIAIFLVVVAFVQGLTYMEHLEKWFPFLRRILKITVISQIVTGYIPSLILQNLASIVSSMMILFSSMQGYISVSAIEKSACYKMLLFMMWIVFFANVLTGSVTRQFSIFLDPRSIPARLAAAVPAQASFFIAYVVTSWTRLSWELNRTFSIIANFISWPCSKGDEMIKPSVPYHAEIPTVLLFQLLGFIYCLLAPLILPFILVYLCMGYIIYRNQLLNVYQPKYETGGRFWTIVHNTTIFSLILMQIIVIGIFGLKNLPIASSLFLPLPILTLLFNDYCRKRFLPIFHVYSAETLKNKDEEDKNDPDLQDFLNNLHNEYHDPALRPIQLSTTSNDLSSPLLSS